MFGYTKFGIFSFLKIEKRTGAYLELDRTQTNVTKRAEVKILSEVTFKISILILFWAYF